MKSGRTGRCVLLVAIPLLLASFGCARKPQYVGRVEIIGDVEMPGFYGMVEGQNARTVVKQAGEVDEETTKHVLLFHADEKAPYRAMLLKNFRDYAHKIVLKPDDVVVFSRIAKPQYYLSAKVEVAGAHPWTPNMTVGEGLNAADLEGQHFLTTGIRVSRYGDKEGGAAARRADKLLPGDTILLYDLFQATVLKKKWVTRPPRKKAIIIDEHGKLKGVQDLER